ncbi:Lipase 4 like protein [Verticillium longisporum]|nr:Lipase 4 like protein [Verticillium longisporum]
MTASGADEKHTESPETARHDQNAAQQRHSVDSLSIHGQASHGSQRDEKASRRASEEPDVYGADTEPPGAGVTSPIRDRSRAASTRSRPISVVPASRRRGFLGRLTLIPELERPQEYSNKTKWCITAVVALAGSASPLGSAIFYPALPQMAIDLNTSTTKVNLSVSLYMLAMAIFPLWWSSFSEVMGRRNILLVSFALFVVFSVLSAISTNVDMLVVMRFFGGGASASVQAVGAGTIADIWEPRERGRAMSTFYLGPLVGPLLGPILGGVLSEAFGWQSTMWFLTIYGAIVLVCLFFCLPETLPRRKPAVPPAAVRETAGGSNSPALSRTRTTESIKQNTKKATALFRKLIVDPLSVLTHLRFPAVAITVYYAAVTFGSLFALNISVQAAYSTGPYNFNQSILAPSSTMKDVLLNHVHPTTNNPALRGKKHAAAARQPPEHLALDTLSRALKSANAYVQSWRDGLTQQERAHRSKVEERRQILCLRMQNAESRTQWQDAAEELDLLERNDQWKLQLDPSTPDYNPQLIEARLKDLDDARVNCDVRAMLYLVRTALARDLGGMGNVDLYRHSYVGTKHLIERYVASALQTIEALVDMSHRALPDGLSQRDILENVLLARQSFGRSALLLSGGATFGMAHIGVLKALFEVKLLPRIISGASAGSIVCAVMCTRTDEEIPDVIRAFPYGDLNVFDGLEKPDTVLDHIRRLLTEGSWSDISHLTRVMRDLLGDMTFQEAYNRTRRILNICVSTESIYELPRLLNYVTAPNVMIWSAVAASCSVPLVFSAAPLLVKVPDTGAHMPWNPTPQRWIDGSVDNDLPMTRLAEMFNVNHFIVSQVNPHVVPFLAKDDRLDPTTPHLRRQANNAATSTAAKDGADWVYTMTALAKDEALHRLQFLAEIGFFPNLATKLRSVLSQKYSGDINILPEISMNELPGLLSNPTSDFMIRVCLLGERATWPKLSRIRDRCAIELGLDHAVHRLRARVVFSASQVDLRRLATGLVVPPPWPFHALPTRQGDSQTLSLDVYTGVAQKPPRQRRSSGSSLQLLAHHRRMMLENVLTDEETEEEERLEMRARHGGGGSTSPVLVRKPRLKRSAKSQSYFNTALLRSAAAGEVRNDRVLEKSFDFGTAPTPPGRQRSPTEEVETSEVQSWSEAGGSDETVSDVEPYESTWAQPDKKEIGHVRSEQVSQDGGLWD